MTSADKADQKTQDMNIPIPPFATGLSRKQGNHRKDLYLHQESLK